MKSLYPALRSASACMALLALACACAAPQGEDGPRNVAASDPRSEMWAASAEITPAGPWPQGDQRGNANTQGPGTWMRCAFHMSKPDAKVYELSHERSMAMPQSPFSPPLEYVYRPTAGIPYTAHAFNGEHLAGGEPGAQGTQMDALGHFAWLPEPWLGEGDLPADSATYYGGYTQAEVKPTPDSPLLKLGMEQAPPLVTSALLLDARAHMGGGEPLPPGQTITAADIDAMLAAQGLAGRGILPGDVLYIHTGWSENWNEPSYYAMGPGLGYDAAQMLGEKGVALVALDNPFTDPANDGQLAGQAGPPEGTPEGLPFVIHHHNLTQSGVHNIQNANLAELAADQVWESCTIILPLRSVGASGSPIRPIAIG